MRLGENVGTLRHKMNTTKDDVVCVGSRRRLLRELERIAAQIGVANNLVALIMMPEHYQFIAEFFFCLPYSLVELGFREHPIERRERLVDRRIGWNHVVLTRAGSVVSGQGSVEVPRLLFQFRIARGLRRGR